MIIEAQHRIASSIVPKELFLDTVSRFFGPHHHSCEQLVYDWAARLCPSYKHNEWHFFELSNGGFYMAPDNMGRVAVRWHRNRYNDLMGSDAFGIVTTLYALDSLIEKTRDRTIVDRYRQLRAYAIQHVEAANIQRAIDD
jgi:hypothetical protein